MLAALIAAFLDAFSCFLAACSRSASDSLPFVLLLPSFSASVHTHAGYSESSFATGSGDNQRGQLEIQAETREGESVPVPSLR